MFVDKIMQISDPIHGSIQISEMEKQIISTQVFNRLHHVLQNSTVYLTFPSNKTSRFAHSIGTMHLGGEMFKYGITNANKGDLSLSVVDDFFSQIYVYLNDLRGDRDFQQDLKQILQERTGSSDYKRIYEELVSMKNFEPFYLSSIPALVSGEFIYQYIVTFQSVRCAALLHDLGHPPFSHITEMALDNVYIYLNKRKVNQEELTPKESNFYEIIKYYKNRENQLHEQLGKNLSEHIFNVLISDISLDETDNTISKKIYYAHVKHMTLAILNDKNGLFKSLHSIISGAIDCDRLDYVSRDPLASGFKDGVIEYERLVKTVKLLKDKSGKEDKFIFSPSARTLNTIEDFFQRRWKMYKYIIMHHRVVKTDTLLREVIETLTKEYLSNPGEETELSDYQIPNDISGLWKMVDTRENITDGDYINHLIQWDDAWLLSCLRREYFSKLKYIKTNSDSSYIIVKLEELLSNKKKYDSLYKRFDGFVELDSTLLEEFNIDCLIPFKDNPQVKYTIERIESFKAIDLESRKKGYSFVGLFTNVLDDFFKSWGTIEFDEIIVDSIKSIAMKYNVEDFIFKRNRLKTGLDKQPAQVYYNQEIHSIEKYSNIKAELTRNLAVFPPFFIYLYSSKEKIKLKDFKKELGVSIAKTIEQTLQQEYNVKL